MMKKFVVTLLTVLIIVSVFTVAHFQINAAEYSGFKVDGRYLYDLNGDKFIPVGVNKMVIWMDNDGIPSYEEIAKTGANTVRIVWTTDGTAEQLNTAIHNCRLYNMVPMVELHDATGVWSDLEACVDYWTRDDVVEVLLEHQEYLLLNIANECGDASISESDFLSGYTDAITRIRDVGIQVPLIIDGLDWGKDIDVLQSQGPALIEADPENNLMFSVHMWWPYAWGYTEQTVIDEIAESVEMELPLIVGEFGGLWEETETGQIPYETILEQCTLNEVGWLAWSWGPGNNPQTFLDMTDDSTYDTLHDWGLEVAVNNEYSIQNTAVRPDWLMEDVEPLPTATPLPDGNLALDKDVSVSSFESDDYPGTNVVDGDLETRWASTNSDPQYVTIDLGESYDIGKVLVIWEYAYATQYAIQVSDDGNTWTDIYNEYSGDGGTDELSVSATGRYVRIYGTQRYNSEWGYSIWEVGIYEENSEETPTETFTETVEPTETPTITDEPVETTDLPIEDVIITYTTQNDWGVGATVNVAIENVEAEIDGWEIEWEFPGDQEIINLWGGSFTQEGTNVVIEDGGWNAEIAQGSSTGFGFNLNYATSNENPMECIFNGISYSIN
jgi:mannan endo-1,4-beta-mannosidase